MPRDSDSTTRESNRLSRRSVLGAVGTTVATAALSGTAAADRDRNPERRRVVDEFESRYGTAGALRTAFETYANDLLADLADRDLLDRADPAALDLSAPVEASAYHDALDRGESAVNVTAVETGDGTVTADVSASVWTDEGRLSVHVHPAVGEAHAVLRGDDGPTVFRQTEDDVEPQNCPSRYCECDASTTCQYGWDSQSYEVLCCEQSDGTIECSRSGDTCGCCQA